MKYVICLIALVLVATATMACDCPTTGTPPTTFAPQLAPQLAPQYAPQSGCAQQSYQQQSFAPQASYGYAQQSFAPQANYGYQQTFFQRSFAPSYSYQQQRFFAPIRHQQRSFFQRSFAASGVGYVAPVVPAAPASFNINVINQRRGLFGRR